MDKLVGRDINGMRPAPYGKLDTSAIEAPKLGKKATPDDITSAVRDMIAQAVDLLYGDPKDKKYTKIVDMLMMRIRGALQALNDAVQSSAEQSAEAMSQTLDKIASSFTKTLQKQDEASQKSHQDQLNEMLNIVMQHIDELKDAQQPQQAPQQSQNSAVAQQEPQVSSSESQVPDESIQQLDTSMVQMEGLQKQVSDSITKMKKLIEASDVQKKAENAAVSMQAPVDQTISGTQSKSQQDVQKQVTSLAQKLSASFTSQASSGEEGEKKSKKNFLKDVMTGKQFNQLKALMTRQFSDYSDIATESFKKSNKKLNEVDDSVNKILKEQAKSGFSWTKLMLLLSLFVIPVFWDKIVGFLKTLDKQFKIEERIKGFISKIDVTSYINTAVEAAGKFVNHINEFIAAIDWDGHLSTLGAAIWDYVKEQFQEYVSDPTTAMQEMVKEKYNAICDWVKDVWNWVTGNDKDGKKTKEEQKKFEKDQMSRAQQAVDKNINKIESRAEAKSQQLERRADDNAASMESAVTKAESTVTSESESLTKKTSELGSQVDISKSELEGIAKNSIAGTTKQMGEIEGKLQKSIDATTGNIAAGITRDANAIVDKMKQDGAPSQFTNMQVDAAEADANRMPENMPGPNIQNLSPIQEYVYINNTKKDTGMTNLLATRTQVRDQISKIDTKQAGHSTLEHMQNAVNYGRFDSNDNIGNSAEDLQYQKVINSETKPGDKPVLQENITNAQTSKSIDEREAQLYASTSQAYKIIQDENNMFKTELTKSSSMLSQLAQSMGPVFDGIHTTLKQLKDLKPVNQNTVLAVGQNGSGNDLTNANMNSNN